MKKKILILSIVLVLALFVLTGCSNNENKQKIETDTSKMQNKNNEIDVKDLIEKYAKLYNEENAKEIAKLYDIDSLKKEISRVYKIDETSDLDTSKIEEWYESYFKYMSNASQGIVEPGVTSKTDSENKQKIKYNSNDFIKINNQTEFEKIYI